MTANYREEGYSTPTDFLLQHWYKFVLAILALVLSLGTCQSIDAGEVGVVTRFGAVTGRLMEPGINFKAPLIESVVEFQTRTTRDEVTATAASKDLQDVTAQIAVLTRINPEDAIDLFKRLGSDYKSRVYVPIIQEAFKATTAKFSASELITERDKVKTQALGIVRERLGVYDIHVDDLNIINFNFSTQFEAAIESSTTAAQKVKEAENTLRRIEVEAQQKVVQASAEATALRTKAQAEADATLLNAKAQAESQRLQTVTLTNLYVEYIKWSKWNGVMPTTVLGGDTSVLLNR